MPEPTPSSAQQTPSIVRLLLHEPTFHFLVIALAIFALYWWSDRSNENLLEIDQREIDARIFMQELNSGEPLSEQQRDFITSSFVEEQILVREALALGLDNDARIHDLLAQKMRHVLSGDIIQPSDEELENYYLRYLDRYRVPPMVDLEEMVLDRREPLPADVLNMLESGSGSTDVLAQQRGDAAPLANVSEQDLRNIFDADFANRVFGATGGEWVGPFISNRGQHWLRVTSRNPERLPTLDEIRDRVRLEWITEEEEARLQDAIDELWSKYSVRIIEGSNEE
jgi:hypothetical protein